MKKLLLLFSLSVLITSCDSFSSFDKEINGQGVVRRVTRVYIGSVSHTVIYLENGKILHMPDAFEPGSGAAKKTSLAQENDTVFYNAKDEILEIRFHR